MDEPTQIRLGRRDDGRISASFRRGGTTYEGNGRTSEEALENLWLVAHGRVAHGKGVWPHRSDGRWLSPEL